MAGSASQIGYGTLLKFGDGATPETFTTVGEITNTATSNANNLLDATHMESPDGYEEFVGGIKQAGQISFDLHFIPDAVGIALLEDDLANGTVRNYQIIYPDPAHTTKSFSALVQSFNTTAPVAGIMTAAVTLQRTGATTTT